MPCHGTKASHCCKVKGGDCKYLRYDYAGREIACALRVELGDWDAVLNDPRWIRDVKGSWAPGINCRDWPDGTGPNADYCTKCGENPHLKTSSH